MADYEAFGSVLVTGGCGFMGRHVVEQLQKVQPGCKIAVLDIKIANGTLPGVEYHQVDLGDEQAVRSVFNKLTSPPRVIFHLACPPVVFQNHKNFWRMNVDGTRTLVSCAQQLGTVKALVYCSSSSVVHDNKSDLIDADEQLPILQPPVQKRIYTLSKAAAEQHVLAANRGGGGGEMLTAAIRPCTAFGPGDGLLSARIANIARTGRARFQLGEGTNTFDFVYVDNLVHGFLLAASALLRAADGPAPPPGDPRRVEGEAFNVNNGSADRVSFWGFALAMAEAWGKPVATDEIVKIPLWIGLAMGFVIEWATWILCWGRKEPSMSVETVAQTYRIRTLNIDKARRALGYEPRVSLREGIGRTAEWFKEQDKKEQ